MTTHDVLLAAISAGLGALCGAVGGAYGATAAVKEILAGLDKRTIRIEQRVGVTDSGALTGNGIMQDIIAIRSHNATTDRRVTRLEAHTQIFDRMEGDA